MSACADDDSSGLLPLMLLCHTHDTQLLPFQARGHPVSVSLSHKNRKKSFHFFFFIHQSFQWVEIRDLGRQ